MEASRRHKQQASSRRSADPRPRGADRQPATIEQPEGPREISDAPWPSDLDLRTRLIVSAAAATDIPVRTALASIMFSASLQWGQTPGDWRACQSLIVRASAMLVALVDDAGEAGILLLGLRVPPPGVEFPEAVAVERQPLDAAIRAAGELSLIHI